nr:MAG TPA: hypothetical protein [Caudoviricetes sp.]
MLYFIYVSSLIKGCKFIIYAIGNSKQCYRKE